ncbi:hypothetical protein MLD38_008909 [Melastoma candidum]|uniref:Uncharacterized protein n=1 Tax=Melastoma candidum TaxID=119954 RepID=A0ACB9RX60_9MYRT|nr:hypothetical protein MLD38_008909 [Melastoma candidum]
MEKQVALLCALLCVLAVLSASTGFAAEFTRIKAYQVNFVSPTECKYPRSPAMPLGLTSALALMLAHVISNVATGCVCFRRYHHPSNSQRMMALLYFVSSWFAFIIGFLLLLTGAALNDQHGEDSIYFRNYYCYVVKPGVFAGGAILSLVSISFGILYFLALNKAKDHGGPWGGAQTPGQGTIAMAQPQHPPGDLPAPVFVHEDTYIRRQFT